MSSGLLTGALLFVPLYLFWGPPAVLGGLRDAFFASNQYVLQHPYAFNPFINTLSWLQELVHKARQLAFVWVPASLVIVRSKDRILHREQPLFLAVTLSASFGLTLFIRSLYYYWVPVLVFLSVVAALGNVEFFDGVADQ